MQKVLLLAIAWGLAGLEGLSQTKSHFIVQDSDSCQKIKFYLKSVSGTCDIRTRNGIHPINILGTADTEIVDPEFGQEHQGDNLNAWLKLHDSGKESFGSKLSKIFGRKTTDEDNYWNIYFTDHKQYDLDLNYGLGKSYVDLSDIAVEKLRISSGNAHVKVGYHSKLPNKMEMDTFLVRVDLGDIEIDRVNLSKAKVIMAEVDFGTLVMDFEEEPLVSSEVWARVGAGGLEVGLPIEPIPMIIFVKKTSYRKVKMPAHFKEVKENVYVSTAYDPDAENLLTFNIDLSMGSVEFTER